MLAFDDYRRHDGLGLAALVRRGEIAAADLLETAIAAAERLDPAINALSQKLYDEARASLAGVDAKRALRRLPFLLKDVSLAMKGTRTLQGSRLFADAPPAEIELDIDRALPPRRRRHLRQDHDPGTGARAIDRNQPHRRDAQPLGSFAHGGRLLRRRGGCGGGGRSSPSPTPATAAARSAFPPPAAACSA